MLPKNARLFDIRMFIRYGPGRKAKKEEISHALIINKLEMPYQLISITVSGFPQLKPKGACFACGSQNSYGFQTDRSSKSICWLLKERAQSSCALEGNTYYKHQFHISRTCMVDDESSFALYNNSVEIISEPLSRHLIMYKPKISY
jgi:hypothetical protein